MRSACRGGSRALLLVAVEQGELAEHVADGPEGPAAEAGAALEDPRARRAPRTHEPLDEPGLADAERPLQGHHALLARASAGGRDLLEHPDLEALRRDPGRMEDPRPRGRPRLVRRVAPERPQAREDLPAPGGARRGVAGEERAQHPDERMTELRDLGRRVRVRPGKTVPPSSVVNVAASEYRSARASTGPPSPSTSGAT